MNVKYKQKYSLNSFPTTLPSTKRETLFIEEEAA